MFFVVRYLPRHIAGAQLPSLTSHRSPHTQKQPRNPHVRQQRRRQRQPWQAAPLRLCLPLPLCITNDFINFQITESQRPTEHFGCISATFCWPLCSTWKWVWVPSWFFGAWAVDFRCWRCCRRGRCEKIAANAKLGSANRSRICCLNVWAAAAAKQQQPRGK